jgi:hypothetical protein
MKIMSERNASYSERVCREDIPQRIGELIRCPITGYLCQGDLSHLCIDYGCARKAGLSPDSKETF